MAGQIETNAFVTKIKEKNAELTTAAAEGKGKLADATAKVTELKTEMSSLIPEIPEVPSIQGELSKLGSLSEGEFLSKISALVTQFTSAIPGLNDLLGTMGLSSFPPSIDVSSIMDQIPNVEVIDGATVVQPAESKVAEEAPAAPLPKEETDIDPKEISNKIFKASVGHEWYYMFEHSSLMPPVTLADAEKILYVYKYTWWNSLAEQCGATREAFGIVTNMMNTEKADRYTALYTVADSNFVFKGVKSTYIKRKGEHPESADLLDFAEVCNYWWEKKQKNA